MFFMYTKQNIIKFDTCLFIYFYFNDISIFGFYLISFEFFERNKNLQNAFVWYAVLCDCECGQIKLQLHSFHGENKCARAVYTLCANQIYFREKLIMINYSEHFDFCFKYSDLGFSFVNSNAKNFYFLI